ncbi:MAG: hypothetical protein LIP12_17775 [Clostridiales bacterium]|nr:hypothetical protein [Clostridiales bacterium]
MSVLKSHRQESQFEVYHQYYQLRREVTDLLIRDFGFSPEKFEKNLLRQFGGKPYEELDDTQKIAYAKRKQKELAFIEWFVPDERKTIISVLRNIGRCIHMANSIYPQYMSELEERRKQQDYALGWCDALSQELQYTIETLPVDINKYTRFADMIKQEIALIKGWRKNDNRFKKIVNKAKPDDGT